MDFRCCDVDAMTEEQEMFDSDDYAAWSHQLDLESRKFREEDDWHTMQYEIVTSIQEYRDGIKDSEFRWW